MRILIILVCIFVVLLTATTIIVGSRSFEGLVVERPYETGLAWDKTQLERSKLGWTVSTEGGPFHTGKNDLFIAVSGPDRKPVPHARVSLRVTRPGTISLDRNYTAEPLSDGRFLAPVDLPQQGNWDLVVTVKQEAVQADYTLHLYAERTAQ